MRQLAVPVSSLSKGISSTLDFTRALVLTGLELANLNFHTVSERLIDVAPGPGRHWPRKGVWVVRPWRPPFHASPVVRKGPISSKRVSSQEPLLRNLEILASTASIFTQNLAHKPPNLETSAHKAQIWEIFSSQAPFQRQISVRKPKFGKFQFTSPPFQRQISVRKPHTSEIRAAHPYLKTVECPPGGFS